MNSETPQVVAECLLHAVSPLQASLSGAAASVLGALSPRGLRLSQGLDGHMPRTMNASSLFCGLRRLSVTFLGGYLREKNMSLLLDKQL